MIKDKVVFITGASRGIGLATVNKFVANGWRVAGFYNQKAGLEIDTVPWFQLDVANYSSIKTAFSLVVDTTSLKTRKSVREMGTRGT